ncbi:transporter substrate-binding domain-containing protein [Marinimicrobium sp. C6131]|uniref:hypothetical protein n=1 Tax=Marinimicrobium sp. C6131 TaxID=3022676 RepID=UPI00223D5F3E|nr:hypothetical protein [Marinimicrobium sp. C6131]UZJ45538.1 transporter substrate-binding domain-containing protein [Marinimicrobium sp. C6131]
MRLISLLLVLAICQATFAAQPTGSVPEVIKIPYMERAGLHRDYANDLLKLALELSEHRYGPYEIVQQPAQTVIRRQLLELQEEGHLSVALSMPMAEWLNNAEMIPFPIMKGLASYRLFFSHRKNLDRFNAIDDLDTLKTLKIGQGPGWSTSKILEDNGFEVVYGGPYKTLFPMLHGDRFQLLMRGVYEIQPELEAYLPEMPELVIVDGIAIYTYLPMYFFVSREQPGLAERLRYGLKKAHDNGQWDALFDQYFGDMLNWLNHGTRRVFYLDNTNIDRSFYANDKSFLLKSIVALESQRP